MTITFGLGTVSWRQLKEYLNSNMFPEEFLDHPVAVASHWNGEMDEIYEAGINLEIQDDILSEGEPYLTINT